MKDEFRCACHFVRKELYLSFRNFKSAFLDNLISFLNWVIIFGFFMPVPGHDLGALILAGGIATFSFLGIVWNATMLAQDVTDKRISAYLILPMPSWYVFIGLAIAWAVHAAAIMLCLLPIGIVVLWNQLDLSHFSIPRFIAIFVMANLMYSCFALWVSSLVTDLRNTGWLWCRVLNPLFMFSGFFYPWKEAFAISPWIGGVILINPLVYTVEATKTAFFGQEGYLPYWICLLAVFAFTLFFSFSGVRRFKKRIDYV